ncbi:ADP-ribosylation factor-like protein 6-interacting protein 1 [Orussus abietinus]|uniref:ADP-ribosylation factor-like protein 6-interacting protein 1 n=1 Tax=Orussus abietinus TaxID=222816 RepID=UPI0006256227|nr:ADP-ribosylation factor-like protein 6-interacting protein 1 [Orussus abietinus]
MPDNTSNNDKDKHMKQLKRKMECWREVILPLNSVLFWERPWYPGLIVGFTTTIFLLIWFLEPAILTLIALSLLILAIIDYSVPIVTTALFPANGWTGQKERKLEEICQNLSTTILQIQNFWRKILNARSNHRNFCYGTMMSCLISLAWLGNHVNNLLLLYIIVNLALLMPGLRHKGQAQQVLKSIFKYLCHRKQS